MSRAYQIPVKASVSETIVGKDSISTQLDILGILPPERMGKLLLDSLTARGFTEDPCGTSVSKDVDGVIVRVDGGGVVTAEVSLQKEVTVDADASVRWDTDYDTKSHEERRESEIQKAQEKVKDMVKNKLADKKDELTADATKQLEKALVNVRNDLDASILETTKNALIEKAKSMGEIVEQSEDKNGDLIIRVKV